MKTVGIDCRGMQCPAPILVIARATEQLADLPALIHVQADDHAFPSDLEAWCRAAGAALSWKEDLPGRYHGIIAVNGARLPHTPFPVPGTTTLSPAPERTEPSIEPQDYALVSAEAPPGPVAETIADTIADAPVLAEVPSVLDLRGLVPHVAIHRLADMLRSTNQTIQLYSEDPAFQPALFAWASATGSIVQDIRLDGRAFSAAVVAADLDEAPIAPPPAPPLFEAEPYEEPTVAMEVSDGHRKRATLLVMHNDLEALLGAMLTANACAAMGMDVVVFFSFWGINVLRGPTRGRTRGSWLQGLMKWMMPRGPRRQQLGKMHMGGMGTSMMRHFMRKNNVMPLDTLMAEAVRMDVRFIVCSMSMGVMGIDAADLMGLPNLEFAGVATFAEAAQGAEIALTF